MSAYQRWAEVGIPEEHAGHYCIDCHTPYRPQDVIQIRREGFTYYQCRWHWHRAREQRRRLLQERKAQGALLHNSLSLG